VSESDKSQFYGQLALETARARISFNANAQLSDIIISKHFPITNELSESAIIEGLTQVWQSAVVIWNTIALWLSESPEIVQNPRQPRRCRLDSSVFQPFLEHQRPRAIPHRYEIFDDSLCR
jgi:hypothetical protein